MSDETEEVLEKDIETEQSIQPLEVKLIKEKVEEEYNVEYDDFEITEEEIKEQSKQ